MLEIATQTFTDSHITLEVCSERSPMSDSNQALNPEAEVTAQTESPAVEQTQDVEKTEEVSTQQPEAPKKGAQSRIRELNSENKSLKERIAELTNPSIQASPQTQTYTPQTNEDGSIDPESFRRQVLAEANQMIDFRTRQQAVIARINQETSEVVGKYKELDPESDSFDPELNDAIYEAVEAKVKADPTASVKDFVKKQMTLYRREASREEKATEAVVAKQAAQGAIRPTQTKPVDTPFEKLSLEEMRKKLGYAQ